MTSVFSLKKEWPFFFILFIVAFLLISDLLFTPAQPQTFDEWVHLISMKQFYYNLTHGNFPVSWVDGVANYGYPLGQVGHQITNYLGAVFFALTHNILLAYNLVALTGAFLSLWFFYRLLRFYTEPIPAVTATFFFNLAPYRIMNIYIRGDIPEYFASVFIILMLLTLTFWLKEKKAWGLWLFMGSVAALALTHPIMLVVSSPIIGCYTFYLLKTAKDKWQKLIIFGLGTAYGLLLASYYLFPLLGEVKYLYYGQSAAKEASYQFMSLDQYWHEKWLFTDLGSPGIRENRLQFGVIEFAVMLTSLVFFCWQYIKHKKFHWLSLSLLVAFGVGMVISLSLSDPLWQHFPGFSKIQHPWRMLTMLEIIPPLLLALMLNRIISKPWIRIISLAFIILVCLLRFPQLYGKSYVQFPNDRYDFAVINLHSTFMNTVWSSNTKDYPVEPNKYKIIEGSGQFINTQVLPTKRTYDILADTPVRVADYTFYFPGWKLFIDNKETPIEFQDPNYRGVITYKMPEGKHQIRLEYTDTKIRLLGKILTFSSLGLWLISLLLITHFSSLRNKIKYL